MSLIESALEKLRRVGEGSASVPVSRTTPVNAAVAKQPAVAIAAAELEAVAPVRRMTIDLKALRDAGYLAQESLERRFADHFRQIKRPLIEKVLAGDAHMRLIMVSSALPGDGKTFTSINLALSMARERDYSVLLVDADAPRARVTEIFGLRDEPGLMDALIDQSLDVHSLIQHTDVHGLEILPAGKFVENATELLASSRMGQITTRIVARNSRRLVVFDSPPLLASSEARVLTRMVGQIVLVARAGRTPLQAVIDAIAQIDKTRLSGLVLNHATMKTEGSGYYGYGAYNNKEGSEGHGT